MWPYSNLLKAEIPDNVQVPTLLSRPANARALIKWFVEREREKKAKLCAMEEIKVSFKGHSSISFLMLAAEGTMQLLHRFIHAMVKC